MTTITLPRAVVEQALEALEASRRSHYYCEDTWYSCPKHEDGCSNEMEGDECNCGADEANEKIDQSITALRAALAEPVQEPVAYRHMHDDGWEYYDAPTGEDCERCQALYTAPPQRKPLTEEEIAEAAAGILGLPHEIKVELARAIERAHGIGVKE